MAGTVRCTIDQGVGTITIDRPERLNAFDSALHQAMRDALDRVERDGSIRALILTGAGRGFCAGQDLSERAAAFERGEAPDLGRSLAENYNPLIRRLAASPIPVIAAVNGIASGAGAALAIACDLVLAADSARFQFGFVRVALGPDAGTSWLLPRRVGDARALALMLTGRPVDAGEALAIGLCDDVVAEDALADAAIALARQFADGPAAAIRAIKQRLRTRRPASLEAALAAEQQAQATLGQHPDYRAAIAAFVARQSPQPRDPSGG
jgi:2-(1,2-epoxy-1,2-dihydrophenyl)acetyl-CoA isomerase